MKILFITHYFQPEPNFFFGLPFAKELVRRGHTLQILTGFPNYPGGKIYDGYKIKIVQKEIMEGIPVFRFPLYPSHDRSSLKRILCYSTLSASMSAIAPWTIDSADVAYVVQGPATLGLPAIILKWFRRIPFVYNIQDIWPDSLLSTGMFDGGIAYKMLQGWCNFAYKRAARITVIAPGMKTRLVERGVPSEKIEIVYNWCDDSLIYKNQPNEGLAEQIGFKGRFNIVFAGNMGKAQSLDSVIAAAKLVWQDCPLIQFVFIGSGVEVENLKNAAQKEGLNNILFLPRKPVNEIGAILNLADVLLVHLRRDPLFAITIPSKTQAYLAMGRPILMAVEGDASDLVQRAQAGLVCPPESPKAIAQTAIQFYRMPHQQREQFGINGRIFYDNHLAFPHAVERYEQVFQSAIAGNG